MKEIYYGRFKISGIWLGWHRIDGEHATEEEARTRFIERTRFTQKEIQVTNIEPLKYCGRGEV